MKRAKHTINPEQIDMEFMRLPGDLAYLGKCYAEASEILRELELKLEVYEARTGMAIREAKTMLGERVTNDTVASKMKSSADWQALREQIIEAEANKLRAKIDLDAMIAKKDMLISLGAYMRAQASGDPSIRLPTGKQPQTDRSNWTSEG